MHRYRYRHKHRHGCICTCILTCACKYISNYSSIDMYNKYSATCFLNSNWWRAEIGGEYHSWRLTLAARYAVGSRRRWQRRHLLVGAFGGAVAQPKGTWCLFQGFDSCGTTRNLQSVTGNTLKITYSWFRRWHSRTIFLLLLYTTHL